MLEEKIQLDLTSNLNSVPPPPPPPPMNGNSNISNTIYQFDCKLVPANEEVSNVCLKSLKYLTKKNNVYIYSVYSQVRPVLQNGPTCGLVALEMAQELISDKITNAIQLLKFALIKGYSKQGEMFSAENLNHVASNGANCKAVASPVSKIGILNHLVKGKPVLVPYDSDRNHEPCLRHGHSAHWAVLTGFLAVSNTQLNIDENQAIADENLHNLWHCSNLSLEDIKNFDIFVLARHGKSRHLSVWSWSMLERSNLNLNEISMKRTVEEFVIPSGGVAEGLKNKMVLLG